MELINVPYIFHDESVKACLLIDIKFDDPTVIYSLRNPSRSQIFNFNKFVSNLHVKAFLKDNTILSYNYACSGFIDKDHRHAVTRGLRIIENNKLRKLFTKGPKYRGTNDMS